MGNNINVAELNANPNLVVNVRLVSSASDNFMASKAPKIQQAISELYPLASFSKEQVQDPAQPPKMFINDKEVPVPKFGLGSMSDPKAFLTLVRQTVEGK